MIDQPHDTSSPVYCQNCHAPMAEHATFCSDCGQKYQDSRLTLREMIADFIGNTLSLDQRLMTTLVPLLTKPGKVTRDYMDGMRQRYMQPFRLLLGVIIVLFSIVSLGEFFNTDEWLTIQDDTILLPSDSVQQQLDSIVYLIDSQQIAQNAVLEDSVLVSEDSLRTDTSGVTVGVGVDDHDNVKINLFSNDISLGDMGELRQNLLTHSDAELKEKYVPEESDSLSKYATWQFIRFLKDQNAFKEALLKYAPWAIILMLPFIGLGLKVLYPKYYLVTHLTFLAHLYAVNVLMYIPILLIHYLLPFELGPGSLIFSCIQFWGWIIYPFIAMLVVYKQKWYTTVFKFSLISSASFFILLSGFIGLILAGFILF